MIYHTFENFGGEVRAIYNGRLAFFNARTESIRNVLISYRGQNDFQKLIESRSYDQLSPEAREVILILGHEYAHKRASSYSRTGIIINGWRYWARVRHLFQQNEEAVRKYYRARAIYIKESFNYQEAIAKEAELSDGKVLSSKELEAIILRFSDEIKKKEARIRELWARCKASPPIPLRPLFYFVGKQLQKNFAIVTSYLDVDGNWKEEWIADGGLLNDLKGPLQTHHRERKRTKAFLNRIRPEPLSKKQSIHTDLHWLRLGIRTQWQLLLDQYGYSDEKVLQKYNFPAALFVSKWSGIYSDDDPEFELLEDAGMLEDADFYAKWSPFVDAHKDNPRLSKFINFFYLHGN